MWNQTRSAKLSLILTDIITVMGIITGVFLPVISKWYIEVTGKAQSVRTALMIICYICLPFAIVILLTLRRLLKNVLKSEAFIYANVKCLRLISWCCVLIAVITLIGGYFYLPFYIVGIAAGFFALILRVLKNVFCTAIEIKSENELTI